MRRPDPAIVVPALVACAGVALLALWMSGSPGLALELRLPAESAAPSQAMAPAVDLRGFFARGEGAPAPLGADWPRFRGTNLDAVSAETVPLTRRWPADGPPAAWSVPVADGYAGPAVADGRLYLLDYDEQARADVLRCLSPTDGREIWRRGYHVYIESNHGWSRTTPAVSGGLVITLGPKCHVLCADAVTGEFRWGIDLVARYGATVPPWYTGQCPLIDRGRAILAPGGKALMVAVDARSGQTVWETPNPDGWAMTHSSIVPMELAGRRMYVYCADRGVVGADAETGVPLWRSTAWTVPMANAPSPVIVGDGRIFLSGGYGAGCGMFRVEQSGGAFALRELWRLPASKFGSEQHTPVLYGGRLFGVREDGQLVCLDLEGNVLWTSGRMHRFGDKGRGPYLAADGMLIVLSGEGELSLVEATGEAFRPLARAKVLPGREAWAPLALSGGRLIVRDNGVMKCLDLRASPAGGAP